MAAILTSVTNPRVKEVRNLRKPEDRRTSGLFIIEGYKELGLALDSGIAIKELYCCPELLEKGKERDLLAKVKNKGIGIFEVSEKVYEKIAYGNRREGALAIAIAPRVTLEGLRLSKNPLVVIIEHLEKPGNLGAILRTADAAGVDAVIVADALSDIYNPNAVRASLGALFSVPVVNAPSQETRAWLKKNAIAVLAACVRGKSVYTSFDFRKPSAIVLGSEEKGLSAIWMDTADYQMSIPMAGKADSLNVSAAAAVLLFEAVRQRSA